MANTYWNHNGEAQAQYDEMEAAGWEFNQTTKNHMHRYYRYFNDGDAPAHIAYLHMCQPHGGPHVNAEIKAYEAKLEAEATKRILIEYKRFQKAQG